MILICIWREDYFLPLTCLPISAEIYPKKPYHLYDKSVAILQVIDK
jgi:hypothetical protein